MQTRGRGSKIPKRLQTSFVHGLNLQSTIKLNGSCVNIVLSVYHTWGVSLRPQNVARLRPSLTEPAKIESTNLAMHTEGISEKIDRWLSAQPHQIRGFASNAAGGCDYITDHSCDGKMEGGSSFWFWLSAFANA